MSNFKASVQYDDWKGTAAADDGDLKSLSSHLRDTGIAKENEFLVSSSVWVGENHGNRLGSITISAFLLEVPDGANVDAILNSTEGPIPVREVELEMTLEQYIGFFKRFKVSFTAKHLDLEDREYNSI